MDVLLFSKFSSSSKKLQIQLEKTPDILKALNIIYIDNKKIRQQVLNDTKVKVSFLPCLIRLNEETSNFDIYEGQNVFDFFSNIQQHILEDSKLEKIRMEEERLEKKAEDMRMEKLHIEKMQMQMTNINKNKNVNKNKNENKNKNKNINENENEIENENENLNENENVNETPKKVSFTPIDDLDQGINTYIHIEKDNTDSERNVNSKNAEMVVKNSSGNLLSKAMKMQKERESK